MVEAAPGEDDVISFEKVGKRYPDGTVAVEDLTFVAPTGQITVLVGPSGCGKTTSLRMINRMIEPTSGRILIDSDDVRDVKASQLRRGIGYVIQHAGLFPHRKVVDNIATVPLLLGWDRKKARARAIELMERVGLDPAFAKRYPAQLSGGQQQRVGVARALAADPPVLLMDEPFSAVDPIVRKDLQEELLRIQGDLGKTIILVTHDIDEAIKLGDRVAVMRVGGHLAQFDTPAALLTAPAEPFVEEFLGVDRGVRRLSFFPSGSVKLRTEPVVEADTAVGELRALGEPWLLVVDKDRRPLGWQNADTIPEGGIKTDSLVSYGHAFTHGIDSLRAALDSAVLSPSGRAVAIDETGAVAGVATQDDIGAAIRSAHVQASDAAAEAADAEAADAETT